jgi:predicted dehydrogenase
MKTDIADGTLGEILLVDGWAHLACWSHMIDLVQWWLGDIETVSALTSELGDGLDRVCTVSFAEGAIGTLVGASGVFERTSLLRIQVRGSSARGIVEGVNGSYRRLHESPSARIDAWPAPDVSGDYYSGSFASSIDGYCAALRAGTPPPVGVSAGLSELAVEAAVERSASTGQPVRVGSL